jgi:hypothetical protein
VTTNLATQRYTSSNNSLTDLKQIQTMNPNLASMLAKFDGCEGGDAGTPTNPSIWLFGVEPGWSKSDQARTDTPKNPLDDGYSIETQLQWPYNRNAFKLLAAPKATSKATSTLTHAITLATGHKMRWKKQV